MLGSIGVIPVLVLRDIVHVVTVLHILCRTEVGQKKESLELGCLVPSRHRSVTTNCWSSQMQHEQSVPLTAQSPTCWVINIA